MDIMKPKLKLTQAPMLGREEQNDKYSICSCLQSMMNNSPRSKKLRILITYYVKMIDAWSSVLCSVDIKVVLGHCLRLIRIECFTMMYCK